MKREMNTEQAIDILEIMRMNAGLPEYSNHGMGTWKANGNTIAIDTAIAALRAQMEQEKGCEYCTGERKPIRISENAEAKIIDCADGCYYLQVYNPETIIDIPVHNCPNCGRELPKEEAQRWNRET